VLDAGLLKETAAGVGLAGPLKALFTFKRYLRELEGIIPYL
jgi:hypothetical protein